MNNYRNEQTSNLCLLWLRFSCWFSSNKIYRIQLDHQKQLSLRTFGPKLFVLLQIFWNKPFGIFCHFLAETAKTLEACPPDFREKPYRRPCCFQKLWSLLSGLKKETEQLLTRQMIHQYLKETDVIDIAILNFLRKGRLISVRTHTRK